MFYGSYNVNTTSTDNGTFLINYVNATAADDLVHYVAMSSPTMVSTIQDSGL